MPNSFENERVEVVGPMPALFRPVRAFSEVMTCLDGASKETGLRVKMRLFGGDLKT